MKVEPWFVHWIALALAVSNLAESLRGDRRFAMIGATEQTLLLCPYPVATSPKP